MGGLFRERGGDTQAASGGDEGKRGRREAFIRDAGHETGGTVGMCHLPAASDDVSCCHQAPQAAPFGLL